MYQFYALDGTMLNHDISVLKWIERCKYMCFHTSPMEYSQKLKTSKKNIQEEKTEEMCVRSPHTFSANNTTGPAFAVLSFPTTSSPMVLFPTVQGLLTEVGCAIPHEHASSRGSFKDIIDTFDFQS